MPIKYILFDNDNTTVRTEAVAFQVVAEVLNAFLAPHGKTVNAVALQKRYAGDQMPEICEHLFSELQIPFTRPEIDALAADNKQRTIPAMREHAVPTDGIVEQLEQLTQSGRTVFLVTSSEITRVQAGLDKTGLNRFFKDGNIYTVPNSLPRAGLAAKPKPDPAIYNLVLAEQKLAVSECVAVEDSGSGIKAARAAGLDVIGYTGADPLTDAEREILTKTLVAAGASWIIHHMSELGKAIGILEVRRSEQMMSHFQTVR